MTLGLDTASVDNNAPPDYKKAFAAGARFIYLRGMQRLITRDLFDPHYSRDAENARKAGLVVGSYLFPSYNHRAPSPKHQVASFKKATAVGRVVPFKDLPPMLDVECKDWPGTGHSKKELVALTEMFVRELEDAFGCKPGIYTSHFQWEDLGYPKAPWAKECPLWVKTAYQLRQGVKYDAKVAPKTPHTGYDRTNDPRNYYRIPDPWNESGFAVQQYLGDTPGFPGFTKTVDVNRFNTTKIGSKGPFVRWIQRSLELEDDGIFGSDTDKFVRAFQKKNGLLVDGEVGPRTFAALAWS